MNLLARLLVLILIPLTALVACTKDGEADAAAGNQVGQAAFAAKTSLSDNHRVFVDEPSRSYGIIQQMGMAEAIQVRRDLVEFRGLTQQFLAWGHSGKVSFVGNSEYVSNLELQTAQQLIDWVDQRKDSFEQSQNPNRPRGQNRDRDRHRDDDRR